MNDLRRAAWPLVATLTLILAACGGTGASGGGGSAPAGSATAPSGAAAEPAETAQAAAANPSVAASAGAAAGGASAGGVCDLVTGDELASLFNVPSVSTTVLAGPPDNCIVQSDAGRPLVAWSYTTSNATGLYGTFALPGQSVDVPGLGDRAAFVENTGLLVLKGDAMVIIALSAGADLDEDAGQEVQKQIGALVAARM